MLPAILLTSLLVTAPAETSAALDAASLAAVSAAVRARLGAAVDVAVEAVGRVDAPAAAPVDAVLDPTAALGRPSRVVFRGRDSRGALVPIGGATVVLAVTVDHLHTARPIRRGALVAAGDVVPARHALGRGPLRPWPAAAEIVDGRATRELAADACLAAGVVAPQPVVRQGDEVTGVLRLDAVEARAVLVAVDSGRIGARIRVMNADSRRLFRARIVARALVEIEP